MSFVKPPFIRNFFLLLFFVTALFGCENKNDELAEKSKFSISGETQGTTYSIIYYDNLQHKLKSQIDSILHDIDLSLSGYIDNTLLDRINKNDTFFIPVDERYFGRYLCETYRYSKEIFKTTDGAFDPSVLPLVRYWGFDRYENKPDEVDSSIVDSLVKLCGFNLKIDTVNNTERCIREKRSSFDFNAIAQGYSVDVLGDYLCSLKITDFMIEVGGEILLSGVKPDAWSWQIGIDKPVDTLQDRELQITLAITDKAVATSGNYRKFYIKDGVKYAHTINPHSGYPVQHNLLSASVVADQCWKADGYATAFMVWGLEHSLDFIEKNPQLGIEAYFIYSDTNNVLATASTTGFNKYIDE